MMKISFSGFTGSGKTSLLNEVKKILSLKHRVEYIDEIRGKNPFDNDKQSSFISQFFYMSTQINEENVKTMNPWDFLLCDQSVLDQWVNWNDYITRREMSPLLEEKNKLLKDMYRFWIKTYDLIFLIRMDFKALEKRDFQHHPIPDDLECVRRLEEFYTDVSETDGLKVIEIWNNKSIDESAHEIVKHIYESCPDKKEGISQIGN